MDKPHVKPEYPHSELTARIIAAAQEVHRTLGPGFEVGRLINFGGPRLAVRRLINQTR
jgi:hypothetical protein